MYRDLLQSISECFENIPDDYVGQENIVSALIDRCQETLEAECEGHVGPWEQRELEYARTALAAGWLRLALTATEKAVLVSQLPRDEYEYGMNYGKSEA